MTPPMTTLRAGLHTRERGDVVFMYMQVRQGLESGNDDDHPEARPRRRGPGAEEAMDDSWPRRVARCRKTLIATFVPFIAYSFSQQGINFEFWQSGMVRLPQAWPVLPTAACRVWVWRIFLPGDTRGQDHWKQSPHHCPYRSKGQRRSPLSALRHRYAQAAARMEGRPQ